MGARSRSWPSTRRASGTSCSPAASCASCGRRRTLRRRASTSRQRPRRPTPGRTPTPRCREVRLLALALILHTEGGEEQGGDADGYGGVRGVEDVPEGEVHVVGHL